MLLLCLGVFLVLWAVCSPFGWLRYREILENLKQVQAENISLRTENEQLRREIRLLREDPDYLAEMARKKYGFVKKNEVLFLFEEGKK